MLEKSRLHARRCLYAKNVSEKYGGSHHLADDLLPFASLGENRPVIPPDKQPWYRTVTRWGQINITEKDPQQYDIDWWRKFWKTNKSLR